MAAESAIIIPVNVPVAMRRLRDGLDAAAAAGVPPHVTLLYPFMPPDALDEGVRAEIGRIIASESAFAFVLARIGRWPDGVYLPAEPADPFSRLIGRLAGAYPDYPPYGRAVAEADIVPHVTITHSERVDFLDAAAHALPALLPVRAIAREAIVIVRPAGERWRTLWRLPLSAGGTPVRG